jgi:hypothetical protein
MQNRQQMLASPQAQATYKQLQRRGVVATVCRGTAGDDFNFFYSDLAYWSDNCLGWVSDTINKSKVCASCVFATAPEIKSDINEYRKEARKESRNSNRAPRQPNESSKHNASGLRQLHASCKHSGNDGKSIPVDKIQKTEKIPVKKRKIKKLSNGKSKK